MAESRGFKDVVLHLQDGERIANADCVRGDAVKAGLNEPSRKFDIAVRAPEVKSVSCERKDFALEHVIQLDRTEEGGGGLLRRDLEVGAKKPAVSHFRSLHMSELR